MPGICTEGISSTFTINILCVGLDLPGFLGGSNFLLPWDITIQTERDKWPTVGETSSKKGKQKKSSRGKGKKDNCFLLF